MTNPYHFLKQSLIQKDMRLILPVLLAGMIVLPYIHGDKVIMQTYLTCMKWVVLCVGLRLVALTGRVSIAQAAFMGVGAYTSGILALDYSISPWLGLILGGMAAMVLATVLGFISLRLSGVYFVIITLALSEIIIRCIYWQREWTGGDLGRGGVPSFSIGGYDFGMKDDPHYYLLLFITILALFVMYRIEHSRIGLAMAAAGQNNQLAQHLGINVTRYRVLAWSTACFFAGVVGAFWAHCYAFIAPSEYGAMNAFWILLFIFIGGIQSFWGPVIGAVGVTFILEEITFLETYTEMAFGLIIILIMLFLRGGLITLPGTLMYWIKKVDTMIRGRKAMVTDP